MVKMTSTMGKPKQVKANASSQSKKVSRSG
jgi:hypothetical protein